MVDTPRTGWLYFLRQTPGFTFGWLAGLLLAGGVWAVWQTYADHTVIESPAVWVATGGFLINLLLAAWSIRREPFASYLLVGATIVLEILVMSFVYLS